MTLQVVIAGNFLGLAKVRMIFWKLGQKRSLGRGISLELPDESRNVGKDMNWLELVSDQLASSAITRRARLFAHCTMVDERRLTRLGNARSAVDYRIVLPTDGKRWM